MDAEEMPRPSPAELIEGALARVAAADQTPDPPGNEWHFALGVLFALGSTRQLDDQMLDEYDRRMQAERLRLSG
jgi:hypothetical protein